MPAFPLLLALLLLAPLPLLAAGDDEVPPPTTAKRGNSKAQAAAKAPRLRDRTGPLYADRAEAMQFADEVAERRGLDAAWVRRMLGRAHQLAVVSKLMQPAPPGQPKNWAVYRSRFIDPVRIAAGARFWEDNRATLARAEQDFGVPPEIVVGIVGVETIYGQQMGKFRILDALATLAFDFPDNHPRAAERTAFFRKELESFLVRARTDHTSPLRPRGSYAGAWGMPQFMPTSVARWGVDYDGDGRIDLARSPADVIGSVANYFKGFGWNPGMPALYPVRFDPDKLDLDALLAPDILPTFSVASFQAKGAILEGAALEHRGPLALVELQNGDDPPSFVAGTENFYVITRYNQSSYYAMAVVELGQAVKEVVDGASAGKP